MTEILLIPGLWNSGPEHWQSYWEGERSDCRRVEQSDWQTPRGSEDARESAWGVAGRAERCRGAELSAWD
jgi:hypothetical protein